MPVDFTGYWKMLANDNFEEYLRALDVNVALRKIASLLKPDKEIVQDGDHMIIRTLSTFRNYIMDFQVGKEFEEDLTGIDDRKCMFSITRSPPELCRGPAPQFPVVSPAPPGGEHRVLTRPAVWRGVLR
ncbi:retinol-binding protein 1 isoform X2 [Lontra canadensis]|uniref:retinol-binding protein 1 isoform X2 n=1 Tax=Lontra canadensis TaxID=76717 RepID=UPI0013F3692C|nr:retinol-binding protein 1 isoform X2 [Lontra canadensis]